MKRMKFEFVLRRNGRLVKAGFESRDKAVQFARKRIRKTKEWRDSSLRSIYNSNPTIGDWGYSINKRAVKETGTGTTTRKGKTSKRSR